MNLTLNEVKNCSDAYRVIKKQVVKLVKKHLDNTKLFGISKNEMCAIIQRASEQFKTKVKKIIELY